MGQMNKRLGYYTKLSIVIFSPIILYYNELKIVLNEALKNDLSTHILAIPFLIIFLLYRERDYIKTVIFYKGSNSEVEYIVQNILGFTFCLLAFIIKVYGSTQFHSLEYHILSLFIFVIGLIVFLYSFDVLRTLYFEVFMLVFLFPPPFRVTYRIGSELASLSAYASYNVVKLIGLEAFLNTDYGAPIIYLTTRGGDFIPFAVDIGCSGIYSLIGFIIFGVFLSYISKGTLINKLMVLIVGVPIIYLLNVIRVTVLLLTGYFFGVNVALNIFHLLGGWVLILLGTFSLLTVAEKVFKTNMFGVSSSTCDHSFNVDNVSCIKCGRLNLFTVPDFLSYDLFKVILSIALTGILFSFRVPVFSLSAGTSNLDVYEPGVFMKPINLLPEIEGYDLNFIYRDFEFENISNQDASIMYQYRAINQDDVNVYVGVEIAPSKGLCHPWEACLIQYAGERKVTQVDLRDLLLSDNPPVSARYFAYYERNIERIQVILYWYTRSIFRTSRGFEEKWAKISVIAYTWDKDLVYSTERDLLPFAEEINNYWNPVSNWSQGVVSISENAGIFLKAFYLIIVLGSVYSLYLWILKRVDAQRLYQRINDPNDISLIEVVRDRKTGICMEEALEMLQEKTGSRIELSTFNEKIQKAVELGILEPRIVKIDTKPHLYWKSRIR
jgi:exosortase/archaeosortase family protein